MFPQNGLPAVRAIEEHLEECLFDEVGGVRRDGGFSSGGFDGFDDGANFDVERFHGHWMGPPLQVRAECHVFYSIIFKSGS